VKVLSLSDQVLEFIYNPSVTQRFGDVDLVLGCGDLPYYYLEYLTDQLGKPVYYVRGNHASEVEYSEAGERTEPWGAVDLHGNVVNFKGLLMAGFEGCLRYRPGPFMYTQTQMWWLVFGIVPRLILNFLRYGRALDVLVTHAPPFAVQDGKDLAHKGFKAFNWLLKVFRPRYHFHGHIHVYGKETPITTRFHDTLVLNSFAYRETTLHIPELSKTKRKEKLA
jgi:Icc-related predicted phosphoesterase